MKITLKTLQGKQLPMEIQADMTVSRSLQGQKPVAKYFRLQMEHYN